MSKISFTTKLLIILFLPVIFVVDSCVTNPVTGKKDFMLMSEKQEIAMGAASDPSIIAGFGLYPNDEIQAFINQKGQEMARISHRSNLNYEFKVLDSPVVNAFALPGGYVYFTRGILAHFNNEAEFAGVLGHEIGHITARHSAKQYSKQVVGQLGLIVGMVVSEEFAKYADVANTGLGLLFLKFGRDAESQSDQLGVEYSTKIGYDAHEMAGFFQTLNRLSGGPENRIPVFTSTHPDPVDRHDKTDAAATQWQQKDSHTRYAVNRNEYLRMIEGIVYGEDPRQGFVENNIFYHPELKFEFPVPGNWAVQNTPSQVQMAPEDGKALMILSLAPGNSLGAAADSTLVQFGLTQISRKNLSVNGFSAIEMIADQTHDQQQQPLPQEQQIRTLTYLIQYNGMIYKFIGLSLKTDFSAYENHFMRTMNNFKTLTDQSKINKQPERIRIQTITSNGTLKDALRALNQPSDRHEELSILNGMELTDPVTRGMLIKTIGQ
ncbi:MAG: M48 family metalloprotease [Saprospiraceae bacterium]|nr:M48 family metalloprotease [Saprospiraceae bacterium]